MAMDNNPEKKCETECPLAQPQVEGWQQRFIGDKRMIQESAKMYKELGYEVKIAPLELKEVPPLCQGCSITQGSCFVLFTRKEVEL